MEGLTVSELARRVGTGPDTVRYYERMGLLRPADRTPSGYRQFGEADVERMGFIRHTQRLGLALSEIAELLEIRERGLCPCGHTRDLLASKLPEIDAQVAALLDLRATVRQLLAGEQPAGTCGSCPPPLLQITTRHGGSDG